MTELQQAYGDFEEETYAPSNNTYEEQHDEEKPTMKQPVKNKEQYKQYTANNKNVDYPVQEYAQVQQPTNVQRRNPGYSFWDRMSMKRAEVVKLAIFSLVIVLAIALYKLGTHYMTKYISDNILSEFQEFMVRLAYPILIFLVLWIIKSL
jgi:hypothetical protein